MTAVYPKTTKYAVYAAQVLEVLQAFRVNETRKLTRLERKRLDVQVSFLFEIQDRRAREYGSLVIDVCVVSFLTAIMSRYVGSGIGGETKVFL